MTDYIVCFDTETTGLDVQRDFIIQLSLVKFNTTSFEEVAYRDWYIRPSDAYTITPEAQAVHHISREKIEQEGVSLKSIYPELMEFVKGCDMLSYNGNGFDVRILYYNLLRENLAFDFENRVFYDAYIIEVARTSRRLSDVYRRYYERDFPNAHDSLADVRATIEVFKAQIETKTSGEEINRPEFDFVSLDGFLAVRDGVPVFAQGKYRGKTVSQVRKEDPSYIDWVMRTCAEPTKKYLEQPTQEIPKTSGQLILNFES